MLLIETKRCSTCDEVKPLSLFRIRRSQCRQCYNEQRRGSYASVEDAEGRKAKRRAYEFRAGLSVKRKVRRALPEVRAKEKRARDEYRSRPDVKDRLLRYKATYMATPEAKAKALWSSAKLRAIKYGLAFTLTEEWVCERVVKKRVCELTGLSFEYGRPPHGWKNHPSAPSIDQIVARKGYTPENCRVILSSLNNAFGEWGEEVYLRAAVAMLARRKI